MLKRLFVVLWGISAVICQAETVSPDWDAQRIRNARPASAEAIEFSYQKEIRFKDGTVETENGKVTLASDFTYTEAADARHLDDFSLCRTMSWKASGTEFNNDSCFVSPAFRILELKNRRYLQSLLDAATGDKKSAQEAKLASYWPEQELAVMDKTSLPLTRKRAADKTVWSVGNEEVATVSLGGQPFSDAERKAVARYFARHTGLHPQILKSVLESGQIPREMVMESHHANRRATETIRFSNVRRLTAQYPLPANLKPAIVRMSQGNTIYASGLKSSLKAVAGNAEPPKPGFDDALAQMQSAAAADQMEQALMWFFLITQQYTAELQPGSAGLAKIRALGPVLTKTIDGPKTGPFWQASNLAGSTEVSEGREAAAKYLAGAKHYDSLTFGTFRYVTFANLVLTSKDTDKWDKAIWASMPSLTDCYWTHIAAYPFASNAFKDLGDHYYGQYEMDKAWQAWDLGRAIDPDWTSGAMVSVGQYETQLREVAPNDF
ncbi:hypothetical protein Q1W73_08900 [Asticcacaulis sp. ZE23SCel15]|uniref:hypothetical protein n=1 Tax=Asticcacaulis sp. ZE23SCel15 TaxID=3059027 RepID=UPI00265FE2A4|nr:hypothetical protein [Asticcacaulis sp. ZE23SCel15]WKL55825.1 hypothetical protein Q1W73_08900 [Asticcacaulis sp. ZE23SCel15]